MASNLAPAELFKYNWRISIFLNKYQNREPFTTLSGRQIILDYDTDIVQAIRANSRGALVGKILVDVDGNKWALSDLKKTDEFGGKELPTILKKEYGQVQSVRDQFEQIKSQILSPTIPIVLNNRTYQVFDIVSIPGQYKADAALIDETGREIIWISLKADPSPSRFRSWSGMSSRGIAEHPEVKSFIATVKQLYPTGIPTSVAVGRQINDNTLKMRSVFGIDYGRLFGRNNVNLVLLGDINISSFREKFVITSSAKFENGQDVGGEYQPTLFCDNSTDTPYRPTMVASFREDRNNFGVASARFDIIPYSGRRFINV